MEPAASASDSVVPTSGGTAPGIDNPLDPAGIAADPCTALTEQSKAELGFGDGDQHPLDAIGETACSWFLTEYPQDMVLLAVVTGESAGLASIYDNRDTNDYFEPTTVSGYPAVYTAVLDGRSDGHCELWVGVNDQTPLYIATYLKDSAKADDPCSAADDVADAVLTKLGS